MSFSEIACKHDFAIARIRMRLFQRTFDSKFRQLCLYFLVLLYNTQNSLPHMHAAILIYDSDKLRNHRFAAAFGRASSSSST
jgi:hypothetical protein